MPPGVQLSVAGNSTIATTPGTPRSRTLSGALAALSDLSNRIIKSHAPYCGAGAFSDVYRRQYDTGAELIEVAVKSFRFSFALDQTEGESAKSTTVRKMIRRELGVWGRLKHPNIVPFLGIAYGFGKEGNASLVSPWMVNGTLQDFLEKHDLDDRLTIAHRLQLLLDIANGINYLHSFPFVHGDLTCNNILLDHNYNALLADFGYTSMVGDIPEAVRYLQMSTVRPGTLRWAAPEHFAADEEIAKQHTTKSDIYSFGNLALLVLSGKQPWWEVKREEAVIIQLSRGNRPKRPLDRSIDNHHWELIERCWSSVNERPSARDVVSFLQHTLQALPPPSTICQVFHVDPMTTSSTGVRYDPSNDMRVAEDYMIHNQGVNEETARKTGDVAEDVLDDGIPPSLVKPNTNNRQDMADAQYQPPNTYTPPRPNPQLIATALRFVFTSAQEMRAQCASEQLITFVDRHRAELMKVYQQLTQIMATKGSAEQEQQSMSNTQGQPSDMPKIREQPFLDLPPGVPRPCSMEAKAMVNVVRESEVVDVSFVPDSIPTLQKPTQDQIQHAVVTINQWKQLFQQRSLPGMPLQHIPEEQLPEYNQMIEQVFKLTSELEPKLPLYFTVFKKDEVFRRYVAIVMTVARQRQLSNSNSPQYIISPATLRNMQVQVLKLNEEFESRWHAGKTPGAVATMLQPHTALPSAPTRSSSLPVVQQLSQIFPAAAQENGRPALMVLPSQAPVSFQQSVVPPQFKRNIQPSIPSPSLRAPFTSIASSTPQLMHSSPQTSKSPPSKAVGKARATLQAQIMPSPSQGPAWAPFVIGVKHAREEDIAPSSLKKTRSKWGGEPSEALVKRQQKVESIMTDDDVVAFFDRMKELFAMTASTDSGIHHDPTPTLDQILAGVALGPTEEAAAATALSVHGAGDTGPPPDTLSPHATPATDALFDEFIKYDDSGTSTPNFVPSFETTLTSEGELSGNTRSPDKTKID